MVYCPKSPTLGKEMAEEAPQTTDSSTNSGMIAKAHAVKKLDADPEVVKILANSRQDYTAIDARILNPPYDPFRLYDLSYMNNTLLQAISVMEVNIDGTGYQIMHRDGEDMEDKAKKKEITGFFDEVFPNLSMTTIRRRLRVDLETLGYGFLEVIRNMAGKITLINHVDAQFVRLLRLGEDVEMEKTVYRNGMEIPVKVMGAERVFVKIADKEINRRYSESYDFYKRYYKEFGSKRRLDADTGLWEQENMVGNEATELMMFKVNQAPESPYGLPRWINNTPSVLGSRRAEEYNLEFFDSGGLPPILLMIQGASLSTEDRDTLLSYLSGKAKDKHRGLFLEMFSNSGDINATARSSVNVERFGHERMSDAMFMKYDESTARHVRTAFRLPDLYFGLNQNYNYATAHVATMAAEAQVFRVEREEFDEMINTTIMKEIAPEYMYKSNEITLNDVDKQLRALDLAGKQTNVSRKDLLDAISEVTHLSLEEMRDGEMPFIPPGAAQVADPPNMEGAGSQDPNATANTNAGGSHQM